MAEQQALSQAQNQLASQARVRAQAPQLLAHSDVAARSKLTRIPTVKKLSVQECLQSVNGLLEKLRAMSANDIHAFPVLNESQRLVQQLRDAVALQNPAEKDAWQL